MPLREAMTNVYVPVEQPDVKTMLVRIEPENRVNEWERVLRSAAPPPGICLNIRDPRVLFFVVNADNEFIAIEMAENWLIRIARVLLPPFALRFNAQPSEEI